MSESQQLLSKEEIEDILGKWKSYKKLIKKEKAKDHEIKIAMNAVKFGLRSLNKFADFHFSPELREIYEEIKAEVALFEGIAIDYIVVRNDD